MLPAECDESWTFLRELLVRSRVVEGKLHDARVAGFFMVHGVNELWTADCDFRRFPALATRNPLTEAD